VGSAHAAFEENVKGSLTAGKYADLVVWSDDFYTLDPMDILDVKAEMTMIEGKIVCRLGDLNFDGDADIRDLVKLSRLLGGIETPTPAQESLGDVDNSKSLDVGDWVTAFKSLVEP